MKKRFSLAVVIPLFCLFLSFNAFSQIVTVGSGSYTTQLPPPDAAGRNLNPAGTPRLSGAALSKPVPTSDWWTGLLTFNGANLYNYPMSLRAMGNGLVVSYTTPGGGADDTRQPMSGDMPLLVGLSGLSVANATVSDHSDWTVTANWGGRLSATMGMGMPFVYFTKGASDVASVTITMGTVSVQNEMILVTNSLGGANFAVYGPVGSTWTNNAGTYTSTLAGKTYFSVALLPNGVAASTAANAFKQHAYVFPTNTSVSWVYDNASSNLRATYSVTTSVREGSGTTVLQALLPHQWAHLSPISAQPGSYVYNSVRGQMKVLAGNTFVTDNKFKGILPTMPNTAKNSSSFDPGALSAKIDQVKGEQLQSWTDSYNDGLLMNKLIQVARIADQHGNIAARDQIIATVKERLEDWLKADAGENAFVTYYNSQWTTLIPYPAGHYADANLNDHHFHYGYFISAAAAVEQFNPGWASNWGPMVNVLVSDAANWNRSNTQFPFLRNFSPYAGHSWAAGLLNNEPHGNNEESSSEAMNFNAALINWGVATGNTAIRDLGIYLYTTQQTAIEEYWFDQSNRNFPTTYAHPIASRVWGNGIDRGTFWTNDIAATFGIEMVPMTAGSFYLGHNTAYVSSLWNYMTQTTGVLSNTPNPNLWYDVYWSYLAFVDPALAITRYNSYPNREIKFGESDANTYNWIHALNGAGRVDATITANHPLAVVFNKSGVKTYVAHNYSASPITVSYSDGFSMSVPARTMKTNNDIDARATLTSSASQVPTNGTVTLTASVTGTVTKVDFYNGTSFLGSRTSAPFTFTTPALAAGKPNFYVRVYNGTAFNLSNVVRVFVGTQASYTGTPQPIPGTIEGGNYDTFSGGIGQDVVYFDTDAGNSSGSGFRSPEYVDAGATPGEGNTVGWVNAGEYMEYTVNVATAGTYDVAIRYTSGASGGGGPFWFENNAGSKISPDITVAMNDVNWTAWTTKTVNNVNLAAGTQIIRVRVGNGGFNLGRMTFTYVGGGDTTPPSVPTNLASPSKTTNSVNLTWNASTDVGGTVAGYEVFVNSETTARASVTTTSATIGSLTPSTNYSFRVRAKDAASNYSALSAAISVTTDGTGLPAPWATADVGGVAAAGSASVSGTTFTVRGSGADIWGTADEFRYVYQSVTGDVTITARVASLENTDPWAKAGVMIRESTGANVRHTFTGVTAANGLAFQRRTTTGGESFHTAGPGGVAPYWVRLTRVGNVFTSFVSTTGTSWTQVGSETIAMPSTALVGLAITSHNDGVLSTATFDNVSVQTSSVIAVTGVSVTPTSSSLTVGGTQQLTATVAPSNATNKNVSWSSNNTGVATVSSSGLVTAVAAGSATITVTTQDGGRTATSAITVSAPPTGVDITNLSGGIVSAQYDDSPSAERYPNLIDNNSNTKYLTFHNAGWVQYQAPSSYIVTSYTITSANDAPERDPLNWTLQGSNNGSTWTTINTQSGQDFPSRFQKRTFNFSNTTAYTHYRFNLTNNSGTILQLAEIELFGTAANNNGGACTGTAANGDYSYQVSTSGGNVSWTFIPQSPIAGSTMAILYVRVGSGGYAGYMMNTSGSNFTYSLPFSSGSALTFYFTYRVGNTTAERNSSANPHTYTVGTTCSGRSATFVDSETATDEELVLYPNPASTTLNLGINISKEDKVMILDRAGREQAVRMVSENAMDVSHLSSGLYVFRLINKQRSVVQKFIKE